ncbi:aminopeptidase P family protein [Aliiruegeria sabulilitoris]|uniref:aminopeptidase P family protein n=1 Tax=Aliiruegeria sabulilitoris TaxID=1510458 RepID=UPI0008339669|nr:aminopeptidase P family protein [Aliiruegeria sabulilitoris]NDR56552.1 aminopeptidase P family protein [Pseudoruegeria sp. M32A2M]
MYQSFEVSTRPEDGPPRLAALRAQIEATDLDGFLVPRADAHQGEYVAPHDERLAWLTGFTGSAGFCAVLKDIAGVFVDGRYRVQVRSQVALEHFTPVAWPQVTLAKWLLEHLPEGGRIGFDPWLHSVEEIEKLQVAGADRGIELIACDNPVDAIWEDQPVPPAGRILVHPLDLAGTPHAEKRRELGAALAEAGVQSAVLTLPDSIAWLLNIRGSDIVRNPVPHAFAILHQSGVVELYCAAAKVTEAVREHLGPEVHCHGADEFEAALQALLGTVQIDPASAPVRVADSLKEAEIVPAPDPCTLPKARKNAAELSGMAAAHLRDGAAMCRFLCWLEQEAPKGTLTEIDVVRRLEQERRKDPLLRDISFETICGSGPHGAIVHYRVSEQSNRAITPGEVLLVDSGGQYADGTTDITRTVATGPVGELERTCFTRVLQGMIAISMQRWPEGLAGRDLDALARAPLWRAGLDYDHGTGHGVGAYLSVHEGPQRLSRVSDVALQDGMILSNEPGYYREGAFGIRIENLLHVLPAPPLPDADDRAMLAFGTLTWVPIDRRMIAVDMLGAGERAWLDAYHAGCRQRIGPLLDGDAANWLDAVTSPL